MKTSKILKELAKNGGTIVKRTLMAGGVFAGMAIVSGLLSSDEDEDGILEGGENLEVEGEFEEVSTDVADGEEEKGLN